MNSIHKKEILKKKAKFAGCRDFVVYNNKDIL